MALHIDTPDAAVAAVPYLIGFPPRDSLVLLLLDDDDRLQVSVRVDLPAAPDAEWLISLLRGIPEPMPAGVLILAFADTCPGPYALGIGMWALHTLLPLMDVIDQVVVNDGCFTALSRGDFDPEEAMPLAEVANHPVVAACVAAGLTHVSSRDDLVSALAAVDDDVTREVRRLLRAGGPERARGRDVLEDRALAALQGRDDLGAPDVEAVARACRDVHVRDPLLSLLQSGSEQEQGGGALGHVRTRLVFCLIHTPGRHAGAVAATLALLCWADGDGAAALVAADRAIAADPTNTLAPLVVQALQHGLPPDTWFSLTDDIPLEVLRGRSRRSA